MARYGVDVIEGEPATVPLPQAGHIHVQLLGDFRVEAGTHSVDESGWRLRKARSLVKLLALAPARRLHREQLLELLWPDLAPEAAGNNLRTTLHVARRMLERGPAAPSPALAARGELLALYPDHPVWIDVAAFEEAAVAARRSADPQRYRQATALYGGELLPEDRYEEWASDRRETLRQLWLALLRELAALDEERGQPREAIDVLQQLTAAEPADEPAHVALMRLYAQTGQRLQALRQYQHLRGALQQELDVEPDPASTRLYEEILTGRIAVVPPAAEPADAHAEAGRPAAPRFHLPVELTSFVGREPEIAEIAGLVRRSRLVTLTGPGGSGKTRLAVEAARALAGEHPGGVWFVDLAPLTDPALVVTELIATLGVSDGRGRSPVAAIADALRGRQTLIVLDNCEHLVDACAALADELLRAAPELHILATSRETMRVQGEVVWPVPPLRLEVAGDLLQVEAARLFVERARLANPRLAVTDASARAILDICRALDGMPLAIELAAARTRVLPVEQLAARLDDALALLGGGARATPARHQSLRGAIDWSYDLLSVPEQALFRRLAVFAGGFTPEAAETVCSAGGIERGTILELLFHLADKSLITLWQAGASARVRMMEPLRQYALERLDDAERVVLRERHAAYFLALAEQAEPHLVGPDIAVWIERLDGEHDNLRAALAWVIERGDAERGLRLGHALWRFWLDHSYVAEGRRWLSRVLALPGAAGEHLLFARAHFGAGFLATLQRDLAAAESHHTACLAAARAIDDQRIIASAQAQLGRIALTRGDDQTAERLFEEGLAIRRELGSTREVALSLAFLGQVAHARGAYETAQARLTESVRLHEETGDLAESGWSLGYLGQVAIARGDLGAARQFLERALERAPADSARTIPVLQRLAKVTLDEGHIDEAARLSAQSLRLAGEAWNPSSIELGLATFAAIASARSQAERALRLEAAARNVLDSSGVARLPDEQRWLDRWLEPARQALDRDARERAAAQGRALTVEQAVADALAGRAPAPSEGP
jgi:predicted ATPase/DNA-binding SARP family transcriptional activator